LPAPTGRPRIARGKTPGQPRRNRFQAPKGRQNLIAADSVPQFCLASSSIPFSVRRTECDPSDTDAWVRLLPPVRGLIHVLVSRPGVSPLAILGRSFGLIVAGSSFSGRRPISCRSALLTFYF
jgi:hypothetical protein